MSKHVCGAQGFNQMLGDTCPACAGEDEFHREEYNRTEDTIVRLEARIDELEAKLAEQIELADNALFVARELEAKLAGAQKNAAFYRSCALSGEIPKDGDEPYKEQEQ